LEEGVIIQPPPIIAPLVEGDMQSVITSSVWRLFFQRLQVNANAVVGSYVVSFNGRTGAVVPQIGDYSVGQITGAPPAVPVVDGLYVLKVTGGVATWEILVIS
jgi:hypothetical protein